MYGFIPKNKRKCLESKWVNGVVIQQICGCAHWSFFFEHITKKPISNGLAGVVTRSGESHDGLRRDYRNDVGGNEDRKGNTTRGLLVSTNQPINKVFQTRLTQFQSPLRVPADGDVDGRAAESKDAVLWGGK